MSSIDTYPDGSSRGRLRLEEASSKTEQDGRIAATVRLEWRGTAVECGAEGLQTREGLLRLGAEATVQAVALLVKDGASPELLGVKVVRAFSSWVAMACIRVEIDGEARDLLGARALQDEDFVRGGAIAVLDALNRVLPARLG